MEPSASPQPSYRHTWTLLFFLLPPAACPRESITISGPGHFLMHNDRALLCSGGFLRFYSGACIFTSTRLTINSFSEQRCSPGEALGHFLKRQTVTNFAYMYGLTGKLRGGDRDSYRKAVCAHMPSFIPGPTLSVHTTLSPLVQFPGFTCVSGRSEAAPPVSSEPWYMRDSSQKDSHLPGCSSLRRRYGLVYKYVQSCTQTYRLSNHRKAI